jgi:SynChlorMet cassette protein ScmC
MYSQERYCLKLMNGHSWCITATEDCEKIVNKMAYIMRLKSCKTIDCPELIFIRKKDHKIQMFPYNSWEINNFISVRIWTHHDTDDVICQIRYQDDPNLDILSMLYSLYPIYTHEQEYGGFPIHAGLIQREDKSFLLAGPGGTGKSTCCRRIPRAWRTLCDDLSLIVVDAQDRYMVHPLPTWSEFFRKNPDKSWNVQEHFPLTGILFLERADRDEIVPLKPESAVAYINDSIHQVLDQMHQYIPQEDLIKHKKQIFHNSCNLSKKIPTFILRFTLHGKFWEEIERVFELNNYRINDKKKVKIGLRNEINWNLEDSPGQNHPETL